MVKIVSRHAPTRQGLQQVGKKHRPLTSLRLFFGYHLRYCKAKHKKSKKNVTFLHPIRSLIKKQGRCKSQKDATLVFSFSSDSSSLHEGGTNKKQLVLPSSPLSISEEPFHLVFWSFLSYFTPFRPPKRGKHTPKELNWCFLYFNSTTVVFSRNEGVEGSSPFFSCKKPWK